MGGVSHLGQPLMNSFTPRRKGSVEPDGEWNAGSQEIGGSMVCVVFLDSWLPALIDLGGDECRRFGPDDAGPRQ
jgi:hypothetical protein